MRAAPVRSSLFQNRLKILDALALEAGWIYLWDCVGEPLEDFS